MNPPHQLTLPIQQEGRDSERPDAPVTHTSPFEIKGSVFSLLTVRIEALDLARIEAELAARIERMPGFFDGEPIVLDCKTCAEAEASRLPDLLAVLARHTLRPVGLCNAGEAWRAAAREAGLGLLEGAAMPARKDRDPRGPRADETARPPERPAREAEPSPVVQGRNKKAAEDPAPSIVHIVRKPVRTGQRLYAPDGDLTVLAPVNAGAELLAAGNIHVYAPLRGRALAGVNGDTTARIFTQCMEAELVSIAGAYRVLEQELPADVRGRPAQVYLDGEKIVIAALKS